MSTIYNRIYSLCEDNDTTVTELEAKLGFGRGSIGKLKTKGAMPAADRLLKIANYFGVSMDYLATGEDALTRIPPNVYQIDKQKIPVLGKIACGNPIYANEERESYVMAGTEIKADFCLIASGNSMINARIYDGDIVFIRKQNIVENGDIAAVMVSTEGEVTLKRFFYYPQKSLLILKPENPAYEDLIFQGIELDDVHVLGKAIAFQSDVQ